MTRPAGGGPAGEPSPTDYDTVAERYRASKDVPWRRFIEQPSFLALVGDLRGQAVLDLACGEGHYTRLLAQGGAERVVGVDRSAAMVDLARRAGAGVGAGGGGGAVSYVEADVRQLNLGEQFDLVTAAYLLNYARTEEELTELCRAVVRHLRPGGRFVALNSNPHLGGAPVDYRRYGFERLASPSLGEGDPFVLRIGAGPGAEPLDIVNYQLSPRTHAAAFAAAGLAHLRWVAPAVTDEGLAAHPPGHWDTLLQHPPFIFLEARRPG